MHNSESGMSDSDSEVRGKVQGGGRNGRKKEEGGGNDVKKGGRN